MNKNHLGLIFSTVMVIYSLFAVPVVSKNDIVNVGYFKDSNYVNIDLNGDKSGYIYEYMEELSKYTGHDYNYVMYDSWEECLNKLDAGEIDIVAPTIYSEDRKEKFDYCDSTIGTSYAALLVKQDNNKYLEDDFEHLNGIKIGVIKSDKNIYELEQYAKENRFTYELCYYNSQSEKELALKNGNIDAMLISSVLDFDNHKAIARFGLTNYYTIVKKGNTQLLKELNNGTEQLNIRNTQFIANLHSKYYRENIGGQVLLTEIEKNFLRENPIIRAVAIPSIKPLSYFENGEYKGIVAEVMQILERQMNVEFKYIETKSYEESLNKIKNGEADILCLFVNDYNWADKNSVDLSMPYISYYVSKINKVGMKEAKTVASTKKYFFNEKYIEPRFAKEDIHYYENEEECVQAVLSGVQDCAYISSYLAEDIMLKYYNELVSTTLKGIKLDLSIGVSENIDPIFLNIIDKQLNGIRRNTIMDIVSYYEQNRNVKVGLKDFIYQNYLPFIISITAVSLSIIFLLIYIILIRRKHAKGVFELAYVDKLTGFHNFNYFENESKKLLNKNNNKNYGLISFDVNKFPVINEYYGRTVGDNIIKFISNFINDLRKEEIIFARLKSDHFVMMVEYKTIWKVENIVKYLRENITDYEVHGMKIKLILNIGIYYIENRSLPITKMLDYCELARREAKNVLSRTAYFDRNMESRLRNEKDIENRMDEALKNNEFQVCFQPKYNIFENSLYGAEALIRWKTSGEDIKLPEEFIPIFESNGFIIELDFYVLEQVCKLICSLTEEGKKVVPISVNQSRVHFSNENYINRISELISKYNIPPNSIELEITETTFASYNVISEVILQLKELGFKLAVDDFGSEYSSAIMLKNSSIDILKIDKTFLTDSQLSNRSKIIINAIVNMATELGLEIVCEGIETEEQIEFLKSINCKYAQGFYFSKALEESKFKELL